MMNIATIYKRLKARSLPGEVKLHMSWEKVLFEQIPEAPDPVVRHFVAEYGRATRLNRRLAKFLIFFSR